MKKYITLLALVITSGVMAQNLSTWGLSGNADNLVQNPGADPMTSFQLRYAGIQTNTGLNMTAGELLSSPDILANIASSGLATTEFSMENNIVLPHLGVKLGKNYIFAGANVDVTFGAVIDNDLLGFVKYGMADANGNFDANYSGDFSDFGVNLQVNQSTYFGYQRSLMDNKLRVGATYTMHNYVTSFNVNATNFSIVTSGAVGSPNSFGVDYDVNIAGGFDFNDVDSLSKISEAISAFETPEVDLMSGMTSSIGFGLTYKPIQRVELALSMNGLSTESVSFNSITSKVWSGSSTIDGFEYTSQAGAPVSEEIGNAVDQYTENLTSSIGEELTNGNYQQTLNVAQNTNAAANFYFNKRSYIGAHYTSRANSFRDFEYAGFNGLFWLGRNLQLKGGYYLSLDDVNSDIVNAALQFRITPLLQVYAGSNSIGDIATIADSFMQDPENIQIGAATNAINLSAGVSFTAFDGRFRAERKARKEAKAAGKAKAATGLTPAQQQKVDDAAANSSTKK